MMITTTTIIRPNLTNQERKIIQKVDQVIHEFQLQPLNEKFTKFWLDQLDECEKIIKNVCHVTYQRILYQQHIISPYRYECCESRKAFYEKAISVPVIEIQIPEGVSFTQLGPEGQFLFLSNNSVAFDSFKLECDIALRSLSAMTFCRIHYAYAKYLSLNYVYEYGMYQENEQLLKGRELLTKINNTLPKIFGLDNVTMVSEYFGLKAQFHVRFLEIEEAEKCMEKYKKMEKSLRKSKQFRSFWHIFYEYAAVLYDLTRSKEMPFFEEEEILEKILTYLNLCLKYNGNQVDDVMALLYSQTYLLLGNMEKTQYYLDEAFKKICALNPHCSHSVRICYELYERLYEKTGEDKKRLKCLTQIWQITMNLNDKCVHYLQNVENKINGLSHVKGKWRKKKLFLKLCCHKFCNKVETEPGEFQKCSRCNVVYYCSRKCQKKDWKRGHREKCKPCGHEKEQN